MTSDPHFLTEFDHRLFFIADDGVHGYELWGIDTGAGPFLVADIMPGKAGMIPNRVPVPTLPDDFYLSRLAVAYVDSLQKEVMFFAADDDIHGYELFMYDGIHPPRLVKEIVPGPAGITQIYNMLGINGLVFFYEHNKGISRYNVNTGDIKLLPGTILPPDYEMVAFNNRMYVVLGASKYGSGYLWSYDPLSENWAVVDSNTWGIHSISVLDGKLYYVDRDPYLWEYDGNFARKIGMVRQKTKWPAASYHGKIYFTSGNRTTSVFDPSTNKVTEAFKAPFDGRFVTYGLTPYRDKLYFAARDQVYGCELWEWDGMSAPKISVKLDSNSYGVGHPYNFHIIDDALYFISSNSGTNSGVEVHRYKPFPATVQNISFKGEVRAYPNPVTSTTTLEMQLNTAQTLSVELFNTEGKRMITIPQVLYSQGTSRVEVDMRHLPVGNYFYHVRNRDNRTMISGKLVKI